MANPTLTERSVKLMTESREGGEAVITRAGVLSTVGVFFSILLVAAVAGWVSLSRITGRGEALWMWGPLIVAFVIALVVSRVPLMAKWLGTVYALCEGFVLGAISASYNAAYHGIVGEAIGCTLGVALVTWFLYGTGIIRVTNKFYRIVAVATLGAMFFYGINLITLLFWGVNLDGSGGALGIGLSLFLAGIAAANLLVDFDRVDKLIAQGVSAKYEWYMGFAMVTAIIWMYLEILNALGKARR